MQTTNQALFLQRRSKQLLLGAALTALTLINPIAAEPYKIDMNRYFPSSEELDRLVVRELRADRLLAELPTKANAVAIVNLNHAFHPIHHLLYFRQFSTDHIDGNRLTRTSAAIEPGLHAWPKLSAYQPLPLTELLPRQPLLYVLRVIDKKQKPMLLDGSEIVERHDKQRFIVEAQVLDHKNPAVFRQLLPASAGFADPASQRRYLAKASHPGYRKLADTALNEYAIDERGIRSDYLRAVAISRWLSEHGQPRPLGDASDPQALINDNRQGSNQALAQTAALAMRSVDLPARVAYGYAVPMPAREQVGPLLITADMAHAWPEVHIQGFGWLPVDICTSTREGTTGASTPTEKPPCY